MNEQIAAEQPKKIGSIKRSWLITKSTWRIFTLDKEILWVAAISGIIGIILAVVGFGGGYILSHSFNIHSLSHSGTGVEVNHFKDVTYAIWLLTAALLALLSSYTLAAMLGIALKRLRGGDPTLDDGMKAIKKNFKSLTIFSLFNFGIVQALQYLQNRLPLFGKILAFLGEMVWGVAAFFAIPIIVDADGPTGPITATKQSLALIKKSWKEAGVSQFALGTIITLLVLLEVIVGAGVGVTLGVLVNAAAGIAVGVILLPVLLLTVLVSSALEGIAKAVLYYYAVTGEAPAEFDKRLLREAFTPKKARKLFA